MSDPLSTSEEVLDALWRAAQDRGLLGGPVDFQYIRTPEGDLVGPLEFWRQEHVRHFMGLRFEGLGGDEEGSDVVLCWYPGLTGARPVLSFGADNTIGLVAASEAAFLRQLASGFVWSGAEDAWIPSPEHGDYDWGALQTFVRDALGGVESDPNAAMAAARDAHPDVAALITTLLEPAK